MRLMKITRSVLFAAVLAIAPALHAATITSSLEGIIVYSQLTTQIPGMTFANAVVTDDGSYLNGYS
jgi:hypothetical protein